MEEYKVAILDPPHSHFNVERELLARIAGKSLSLKNDLG
jgi:hypothetical protein